MHSIGLNKDKFSLYDLNVIGWSFFFLFLYSQVAWRYHLRVFREWQRVNQIVKIVCLQSQQTSSIVTVGDLHASLPPSVLSVHAPINSAAFRISRRALRDNRVEPWYWQELSDRDAVVGYSVGLNSEPETEVDEATVPSPDEADIPKEYSSSSDSCSSESFGVYRECESKMLGEKSAVIDGEDTVRLVGSKTVPQPVVGEYPDTPLHPATQPQRVTQPHPVTEEYPDTSVHPATLEHTDTHP